jgi:hypothetical protein
MRAAFLRLLAVAVVVALSASPAFAAGRRAEVHDEAHLFTPEAIEKARERLRQISDAYDIDLVIETRDRLSPKEKEKLSRSRTNLRKDALALAELTQHRAEEVRLDGLLVVYYKLPPDVLTLFDGERVHVSAVVWPESRHDLLAPRDLEEVRKRFAGPRPRDLLFRRHAVAPDQALLGGINQIEEALHTTANRGVVDYVTIPILAAVFLGAWLVLSVVRARVLRRGAPPLDLSEQRPALLGALCGSVPALWAYDKLFRPGVPPLSPEEPATPLFAPPAEPPPPEPPLREGEEPHAPAYDSNQPEAPVS